MSKYMPKTTEWMRQNNWGAEAQQLVTADLASCESSLAEAEREVERLRKIVTTANSAFAAMGYHIGDAFPKPEGRAGK